MCPSSRWTTTSSTVRASLALALACFFLSSSCFPLRLSSDSIGVAGGAEFFLLLSSPSFFSVTDGEAVRAEILKTHKQRSVPAVFVKGKFVGGCNDGPEPWMGALKLLSNGGLREMLSCKL